jgi:hypothetical protein
VNTAQLAIVASTVTAVGVTAVSSWVHVRTNRDALDAQRRLAMQARVATTYEDMFELVNHSMDTVEATKPIAVMGEPPVPPEPVDGQPRVEGDPRALEQGLPLVLRRRVAPGRDAGRAAARGAS